jgi:hypothetical protein
MCLLLVILTTCEVKIRRTVVQSLGKYLCDPTKITRAKRTNVTHEVQCLLYKHKELSSNPSPTRKRKEKKEKD